MTPERWKRVEDLYESASALPAAERDAFLARACADDETLRDEVLSLLRTNAEDSQFLERPVMEISSEIPAAIAAGNFLPDPLVGARVGAYQVQRRIGTGGMGVVYLAQQHSPRRDVALKLIRPGIASDEVLRRFEHEAQILGRLHHPGIAQIYESGAALTPLGVQPFFAMEYVEGEPLLDYVERAGPTLRERLALLIRICDAVQHAHAKGVIHRDIKPGNILVEHTHPDASRASETIDPLDTASHGLTTGLTAGAQPRVLDFGIARMTDPDAAGASVRTEVGRIVGTLAYMSPEQVAPPPPGARASDAVDTRSDVYALGVVAFETLTAQLPYDVTGKPLHDAARVICEAAPTRPGVIDRALRGDVETILLKAIEKDPARRYQTASALADDLRRVLLHHPILARPASTAYQLRKLVSRHKVLAGSLAAMMLVLAGFGVWMSILYTRAERLRTDAQSAWESELKARTAAQASEQLANRRAETAGRILKVLVSAFDAINPALTASQDVNARDTIAREIVDRGLRTIERDLRDEPRIRAHLISIIGNTLGGLGQYDRAASLLTEAIDSRRSESSPPPVEVAEYLEDLGEILTTMGRNDEALGAFIEALAIYRAQLAPDAPEIASTLGGLALLSVSMGRLDEAERYCLESVRISEGIAGHAGLPVADALNSLAGTLAERGEYARAEEVLRRASDLVDKDREGAWRWGAGLRTNLAWVLCMQGKHPEALEWSRWALESRLREFPRGHPRTVPPMLTVGVVLVRNGQAREAEPFIRQCIEIRRAATPDNSVGIGEAESALGECLVAQGRFDEAEPLLLSSFSLMRSNSDPTLEAVQLALQRLVHLYERMGRADQAGEYRALLRPPWSQASPDESGAADDDGIR